MFFITIGIILIAICFCTAIVQIFPKFDDKPILGDICLYSLVAGFLLVAIGAFIR